MANANLVVYPNGTCRIINDDVAALTDAETRNAVIVAVTLVQDFGSGVGDGVVLKPTIESDAGRVLLQIYGPTVQAVCLRKVGHGGPHRGPLSTALGVVWNDFLWVDEDFAPSPVDPVVPVVPPAPPDWSNVIPPPVKQHKKGSV